MLFLKYIMYVIFALLYLDLPFLQFFLKCFTLSFSMRETGAACQGAPLNLVSNYPRAMATLGELDDMLVRECVRETFHSSMYAACD